MKQFAIVIIIASTFVGCRKFDVVDYRFAETNQAQKIDRGDPDDYIFCSFPSTGAGFPGGAAAWQYFLRRNLRFPARALDAHIEGIVILQFCIDRDGTISEIKAVSGPDELKESAIDVIRHSPNWTPAQIRGVRVKDYVRQPISFQLID